LNSGLYRLYRFFFVIRHLPAHYRANFKVSTKPGQDYGADIDDSQFQRQKMYRTEHNRSDFYRVKTLPPFI